MADNVSVKDAADVTRTVAAKDVSNVHHQRALVELANDGITPVDVPGDAANGLDVDVTRSVLPTGAATAAKQPALGVAGSASADVLTVQGIASGVGLSVSAVSLPLPTGASTAAKQPTIGTAGAASVDVLSIQGIAGGTALSVQTTSEIPGVGATNLGKAEDAVHASGDTGVLSLAVRRDANTSLVDATGDYAPFQVDATGSLKVAIISGAGSGGTSAVDNAAFTPGTTNYTPIGAEVDDTATSAATENSAGALRMTPQRGLHANLRSTSGLDAIVLEDVAHASGEPGIMPLAVRRDANTSLVDLTGDYAPFQVDANGSLKVAIISGAGSGGTAAVDNAGYTPGVTSFTPIGGEVDDTATAAATENSAAALRMTPQRGLHANLRSTSGLDAILLEDAIHATGDPGVMALAVRQDTATALAGASGDYIPLIVDANGALHVTQGSPGTGATNLGKAEDAPHTTGDVGVMSLGVRNDADAALSGLDLDYTPVSVDSSGRIKTLAAGTVASGAADAGNPVKVGYQARSTDPAAVTDAQRVNAIASLLGKPVVLQGAVPALTWSYAAAAGGLVNTTGVTARVAGGAGVRNYIKSAQVINSHATISTEVLIRDGAAGTVLHRGWAQAAGGGFSATFDPPLRGTANTLVEIAEVTATATAGVLVNAQGYTASE